MLPQVKYHGGRTEMPGIASGISIGVVYIDNRATNAIDKIFGKHKWNYAIKVGFKSPSHFSIVSGRRMYDTLIDDLEDKGYDVFRTAKKGGEGYKAAVMDIYRGMKRRIRDAIRHKEQVSHLYNTIFPISQRLKKRVKEDILSGVWDRLWDSTIWTRRWKAKKYGGDVKYSVDDEASLQKPLVETGQMVEDVEAWVEELPMPKRYSIHKGMAKLAPPDYRKIAPETKQTMEITPYQMFMRAKSRRINVQTQSSDVIVNRGSQPSINDIISGKAGSGEVISFDDDW